MFKGPLFLLLPEHRVKAAFGLLSDIERKIEDNN